MEYDIVENTSLIESAELYARELHKNMLKKDGKTPHYSHLESVVNRLKSLGVYDEEVLCAGWLHDVIEDTEATFDDVYERFGQRTVVLVSSLSKDMKLPKKEREIQYVKQLKEAPFEAKLVKLCDASANLKDIDSSDLSKTKKKKTVNKILHYLRVIKNEISEHQSEYPKVSSLIDGVNQIARKYHQKPISL